MGWLGIDFGTHWDEHRILEAVQHSSRTGILLPHWYNYPSFSYDLALLAGAPDFLRIVFNHQKPRNQVQVKEYGQTISRDLVTKLQEPGFKLRLRKWFFFVSLLTILWVFLTSRLLYGNPWEGLLAAAILATSWEFIYHARWIAPDTIMVQWATLCLLLTIRFYRTQKPWNIYLAAVAAGLCCSSKYTGAIMLLLVLSISLVHGFAESRTAWSKRAHWIQPMLLLGVFLLAFILTTPGCLIDPLRFIRGVLSESQHYATGHRCYSVTPGLPHLLLMIRYLTGVLLSPYPIIAFSLFTLAIFGAVDTWRRKKKEFWIMLGIPLILLVFLALQRVMFVRNLLLILPFFSLLTARGITFLVHHFSAHWKKIILIILPCIVIGFNLVHLQSASTRIFNRKSQDPRQETIRFLARHQGHTYYMTAFMRELLIGIPLDGFRITTSMEKADRIIFSSRELATDGWNGETRYIANHPGTYTVVSGLDEVNLNYYPGWAGAERILNVSPQTALILGLR